MKCIKKDNKVLRVRDKEAHKMVNSDGYKFVPKSEWKKSKK